MMNRLGVGIALFAVVSTFYFGYQCGAPEVPTAYQIEMAEWKESSTALAAKNIVLAAENDSLRKVVEANEVKAQEITKEIQTIKTVARKDRALRDSALASLQETVEEADSVVQQAVGLAADYKAEADSLNRALELAEERDVIRAADITALKLQVHRLEEQNTALTQQLMNVPVYTPQKILGIPAPSRTTALIAGVAVGVVGTLLAQ